MRLQEEKQLGSWKQMLGQLADPAMRRWLRLGVAFLQGFFLSAASLGGVCQSFPLGVLCATMPGWDGMAFAIGASLGYWSFWGRAGLQAVVWVAVGLPVCVSDPKRQGLLQPALAALIVAASGLVFQIWQAEEISLAVYLLRTILAFGTTCVVQRMRRLNNCAARYLAQAMAVLALAQIAPLSFLNVGLILAGAMSLTAALPAVAMAGLALDLAGITPVPMTGALCLASLVARIPWLKGRGRVLVPPLAYLAVMGACGQMDLICVPALMLGGLGGLLLERQKKTAPPQPQPEVQLRLEAVAAVMGQARKVLQQCPTYPVDEQALMVRCAERSCGQCPDQKSCKVVQQVRYLPQTLLHQSAIALEDLPEQCTQKQQLRSHLQWGQDQYRLLLAHRRRQQECRSAMIQEYGFLTGFLQKLADTVPEEKHELAPNFRPEVAVCTRGKEATNGDRCFRFAGTQGRYYVLLCDGMGTGEGAAYEARSAGSLLRRMLLAGYSAQQAVQSLNSLCALRSGAGAVTVDLTEVDLQTGRACLYKWGAAPSWLLSRTGWEKIGGECLPPGVAVEQSCPWAERISLRQGDVLLMASDGVDGDRAVAALGAEDDQPAGFLAALVLENGVTATPDDATAVVLRLHGLRG